MQFLTRLILQVDILIECYAVVAMSPASSAFLHFWWTEKTRSNFLSYVPKDELATFRLACHDFSVRAAPLLFKDLDITFRPSIFTKPARMAALDRIGQHVRTLTFNMPHSSETFLPPILDSVTGEETTFIYEPCTKSSSNSGSRLSVPTYGSWEMTDLLVKQYSPLFHAAANVPSFIQAFSAIPNLKHLRISCPGQEPEQRYRRSVVDYALISLRIAVERSNLPVLNTLSLMSIHPGAILYLNPVLGFGARPNSAKRWKQIKKLSIHMDSIPFNQNSPADLFKTLHLYLQLFSSSLRHFKFRWRGAQGPCPLSFGAETGVQKKSPALACPETCRMGLRPLRFEKLRDMEVENIVLDASQVSSFITAHRHTLHEFNFEDTKLRSGTWDDALAPLTRISGSEKWKEKSEEVMDVPLVLSPIGLEAEQVKKVIQDNSRPRHSKPACGGWQRAGAKSRELFWGTPEHMRKFLRISVFSWL